HERPQVSILAINKQIHREAGSILYQNLFEFDCEPEGVPAFLRDRPHWALEFITRVGLHLCKAESSKSTKPWRNLCKTIRKQLRLKELVLYPDGPFWEDGWEWTDLDEVEWIRQLVKITGLEKLSIVMYEGYDSFAEDEGKEPADHLDTLLRSKMLQPGGEFRGWSAAPGTWSDWQAP
ncbi:MAG: hypothetical protein M1835_003785, partial [Candelina submexicana]